LKKPQPAAPALQWIGRQGEARVPSDIGRLQSRLQWESAGPVMDIANRATDAVVAGLVAIMEALRRAGEERPLVTLLIACQIGFAVGHWGPRRAKR
jgi:hypothetical protein